MRMTNQMMVNTLKMNISTNTSRMAVTQEQIASGKKINKLSDDPGSLIQVMRMRGNITENEQYVRNLNEGISFLETTDSALDDLTEVIQRIRELTVQAANGTNDSSALQAIAEEVGTLRGQVQTIANMSYGSKYIFAGSNVTQGPCGESEWQGNNRAVRIEISPGIIMPINIDMTSFFGNPNGLDVGGNPDGGVFDMINQLMNRLNAGGSEAISHTLNTIDDKIDELLNKRAVVGARVNRLELQQNRLKNEQISLTGLLSQREDADMAELAINLRIQENVYMASLSAGAKIIMPSLLDFLG